MNQVYQQGFCQKCVELGVDPNFVYKAAQMGGMPPEMMAAMQQGQQGQPEAGGADRARIEQIKAEIMEMVQGGGAGGEQQAPEGGAPQQAPKKKSEPKKKDDKKDDKKETSKEEPAESEAGDKGEEQKSGYYNQGFLDKCAELGVDPKRLMTRRA